MIKTLIILIYLALVVIAAAVGVFVFAAVVMLTFKAITVVYEKLFGNPLE